MLRWDDKRIAILVGLVAALFVGIVFYTLTTRYLQEPKLVAIEQYLEIEQDIPENMQETYKQSRETLSSDTTDRDAIISLASVYSTLDLYQEAEDILQYGLAHHENDTVMLQNLAAALHNQAEYEREEEVLYKLLEEGNLVWMPAYENLLVLYRFDQRPPNRKFAEVANMAREMDFKEQFEEPLLRLLSYYYYYTEDYSSARDYFRQYLNLVPGDSAAAQIFTEIGGSREFKFQE